MTLRSNIGLQPTAAGGMMSAAAAEAASLARQPMDDEIQELRQHRYHQSRIPALDALETFVADGAPPDSELAELRSRSGFSRWYPVPGGHRVLVLYEGGGFNADRFTLRTGVWDHEHCKRCSVRIPSMTLCWVSRDESYVILCDDCYQHVNRPDDAAG